MDNNQIKNLALSLVKADKEKQVVRILENNNFYENEKNWRDFGDKQNNFSTTGNQQKTGEAALVEKLINSIDSTLTKDCLKTRINPESSSAPKSITKAVERFYDIANGKLTNISTSRRNKIAEESIGMICTGNLPREGKPTYTIFDFGEGQTPSMIPDTFMSIGASNKIRIPFVQGKFNMGGTGVFRYSSNNACQLLLTKRNPQIINENDSDDSSLWGFSVVRKIPPIGNMKSSKYVYLVDPKTNNPYSFDSEELNILPGKFPLKYSNPMKFGSFIKLYEYQVDNRNRTNITLDLYNRLSLLMPSLALPVRLYERREGYKANTYETTLNGLSVRLEEDKSGNLESDEWPTTEKMNINGQNFSLKVYAFKNKSETLKRKSPTDNYTKNEGIIFTVNGQTQGSIPRRFFNRKNIGLGLISKSIIVMVDASDIDREMSEELFMNSRDRLVEAGDLRKEIDQKLERMLAEHKGLKELKNRRYQEQVQEKIGDSKPLKEIISNILRSSPTLSKIFISGTHLSNPLDLRPADHKEEFSGKKFPSFFKITKNYTTDKPRKFPINQSSIRIEFKTDVVNDYFDREDSQGEHKLYLDDREFKGSSTINLWNGTATLNVYPDDTIKIGDTLHFKSVINDVSRIEPLINSFVLQSDKETDKSGGKKGDRKPPHGENPGSDMSSAGINLPEIIKVEKNDTNWINREFNEYTGLDVDFIDNERGYVFYLNMHNIYFQNHCKENRKNEIQVLKSQFEYANSLIALSIIQSVKEKKIEMQDDFDDLTLIKQATSCISMILIPMLSYFGNSLNEN